MACTYTFKVPGGGVVETTIPASFGIESDFTLNSLAKDLASYLSENEIQGQNELNKIIESIDIFKEKSIKAKQLKDIDKKVVFETMQSHLKRLGVDMIITDQMPSELRGAEAGVLNGKIYVNSNATLGAPMHEFMHLVFGVLKVDDFKLYQKILESCLQSKTFTNILLDIKKNHSKYTNMSELDLQEEAFVRMIQKIIQGQIPTDSEEMVILLDKVSQQLMPVIGKTFGIEEITDGLIEFLQSPFKDITRKGSTLFIKKDWKTMGFSDHKYKTILSARIAQYFRQLAKRGIIQESECV